MLPGHRDGMKVSPASQGSGMVTVQRIVVGANLLASTPTLEH